MGSDSGKHGCFSTLTAPPQNAIQLSGVLQALDLADPHVAATLHVFGCEPHRAIGVVEFLRTPTRGPLGLEVR